jgi:hypothetical protein
MGRELTPMREFTLEMYEKIDCVHKFQDVTYKWAKLLGQKPTLGMFVPCDEEGSVLEEPKGTDLNDSFFAMQVDYHLENKYQQALSRVIFEGFVLCLETDNIWIVNGQGLMIRSYNLNTLEDLTPYDLTVKFEL